MLNRQGVFSDAAQALTALIDPDREADTGAAQAADIEAADTAAAEAADTAAAGTAAAGTAAAEEPDTAAADSEPAGDHRNRAYRQCR